jgi:hypothetical protein
MRETFSGVSVIINSIFEENAAKATHVVYENFNFKSLPCPVFMNKCSTGYNIGVLQLKKRNYSIYTSYNKALLQSLALSKCKTKAQKGYKKGSKSIALNGTMSRDFSSPVLFIKQLFWSQQTHPETIANFFKGVD